MNTNGWIEEIVIISVPIGNQFFPRNDWSMSGIHMIFVGVRVRTASFSY